MHHVLLEVWIKSMVTVPVCINSNTPLHDTWSCGSKEITWWVIHVDMVWSDLSMIYHWLVFVEVVCQIILQLLLNKLIYNSKVLHFHGSRLVCLDSVICKFQRQWNYLSEWEWVVRGVPFLLEWDKCFFPLWHWQREHKALPQQQTQQQIARGIWEDI